MGGVNWNMTTGNKVCSAEGARFTSLGILVSLLLFGGCAHPSTPPAKHASTDIVRVAVVGHTGGSRGVVFQQPQELVARLKELRLDAVVHAGDIATHATAASFASEFFTLFSDVLNTTPVYIAPGNHECSMGIGGKYDYSAFIRAFPYPFPNAVQVDGVPRYSIRLGSAEFFFCAYYPNLIREGSPELRWLQASIEQSTAKFKIAVVGGNQKTWNQDVGIRRLAGLGVDLIVMGDGSGFSYSKGWEVGTRVLFNGCGSDKTNRLRPYTVLEIGKHTLTLNAMLTSGAFLVSDRILDESSEEQLLNFKSLLRNGHVTGSKIENLDGFLAAQLAGRLSTWIASEFQWPESSSAPRGVSVKAKFVGKTSGAVKVWARFLMDGPDGPRWFDTNPRTIRSGELATLKWALPASQKGVDVTLKTVAFHLASTAWEGSQFQIHDAYVF